MKQELKIYDYRQELETKIAQIKETKDILPENKKLILEFLEDKKAEVTTGRVKKLAYLLLHIAPLMNKDIRKFDMREIKALVTTINNDPRKYAKVKGECSEWYKADMRTALKEFIQYSKGNDYNPMEFKWMRTSLPKNVIKSRVEEGQTLTVEEVEKLIASANGTRDKALIATAYETACRPSEILTLRVGNIKFDQYGAVVNIQESKTRPRPIRVINAATYLRAWLNIHPYKDNIDAPLWVRYRTNLAFGDTVGLAAFNKLLRVAAKKAEIKKRVYSYLLRHSRTTHLVQQYPDQIVKRITGHSPTSKHFEVYLHMSNQDVDQAVLKRNGLLKTEDEIKQELDKPVVCWNCKTLNAADAKICESCNFSIDMSSLVEQMEEIKKLSPILKTLAKLDRMPPEKRMELYKQK